MRVFRALLAVIVVIAVPVGAVWVLVLTFSSWLSHQDQATRTAVIGAVALVIVPIVTYFTTKSVERRSSADKALREHKTQL